MAMRQGKPLNLGGVLNEILGVCNDYPKLNTPFAPLHPGAGLGMQHHLCTDESRRGPDMRTVTALIS